MRATLSPQDLEASAAAAGKTLTQVCQEAGIARSTFTRWKSGKTIPRLDVYQRLVNAAGEPAREPA